MASSTVSLFAAAILLVASLLISTSSGVTQDILSAICSKSQNPKACESILKSDPRTSSADIQELSEISIELMNKQADSNLKTFTEFRDNSTAIFKRKNPFDACVKHYNSMEAKIKEAIKLSEQKQYKKISQLAVESQTLAYICQLGIPINLSPINVMSQTMMSICETSEKVNLYAAASIIN